MEPMAIKVPAIYENGILRPLKPLALPERARVQVQIKRISDADEVADHRLAVNAALAAAELLDETVDYSARAVELTEERREELAYRFAEEGPVSTIIIAERGDKVA
jgi:predicted DNA-binding antitoxin AbrB/MazE fold protein